MKDSAGRINQLLRQKGQRTGFQVTGTPKSGTKDNLQARIAAFASTDVPRWYVCAKTPLRGWRGFRPGWQRPHNKGTVTSDFFVT